MGDVRLLDCTLRDGGYVNDWNFGYHRLVSIFERIVDANVDMIEIGFLDERRPFDINRSIMPDTESAAKIYGNLDRKKTMVVGMVDYGTCSLEHIQPCTESCLDGIRVIFKKHLREPAMAYCAELKKKGYKVFVQLVSVTSYEDDEMMDLIRLANQVRPYAVSMVDTYGLMHQDNLKHYFHLLDKDLEPDIGIGYHAHNNFQMGYANCIEMLSHQSERMMLVDGSLYGMGKSAGNAPIELIAMHMNEHYGKNYQTSQLLEAIDTDIMNFYSHGAWGYSMFHYLAASNDCHPSYVSGLVEKRTLSVKSVNEILGRLQGEKKLLYDPEYMERLYKEYQDVDVDDRKEVRLLHDALCNRKVLLLGPGSSILSMEGKITDYLEKEHPAVFGVNFIPSAFPIDYLFLSNAKRYLRLSGVLAQGKLPFRVIATSNVTKTSGRFDYTLKYSSLLDEDADIIDNSFLMLLKVMVRLGVKKIALAGFDGYCGREKKNYISQDMEYDFSDVQAKKLNRYVASVLDGLKTELDMEFITDSLYRKQSDGKE